jgi:hypothetical protein
MSLPYEPSPYEPSEVRQGWTAAPRPRYEFHLAERMTATAQAVFPELRAAAPRSGTVLYGQVRDSSELHAILDRFHLLGMTLLQVHRLPD